MQSHHLFRALQRSGLHGSASTGDEAEALSSLSAAIVLQKKGNKEKAKKLFRHAMAMCPKHPKILNHYGEFLESDEGQILQVSNQLPNVKHKVKL
jgi:Tfp pilus assembly protein PilF